MRKTILRYLPVLAVWVSLCTTGCSSKHEETLAAKEAADTADYASAEANAVTADTTAVSATTPPDRQFVRTADLKFRVKDVAQTTHTIEDLTNKYGGFITKNHLSSSVLHTNTVQVSADSLVEITEYQVDNHLYLRVPNQHLDNLLHELSNQVSFFDYRIVNADDVSLQILENKLRIKRASQGEQRVQQAIDHRGKKLNESLQGEYDLLALQQNADNSLLINLSLADQVNYSTVQLNIYQRASSRLEKIAAPIDIPVYEPNLASRLADSFLSGWFILEQLLVGIVRLWGIILIGLSLWFGFRRYGVKLLSK